MTEITKEQAAEVLLKENKERTEKCNVEIGKILEKYNCRINAQPFIVDGRIVTQVEIVAL
jgi:hypothetical protein